MKKKIAHIAGGLTTGGVEAVLLNYFSHMDTTEYELHYISYGTPDPLMQKKFEALGFVVHEVPKKKEHFLKSTVAVYRILKENQINIVHSHMTLMSFMTSFLGLLCGVKVRIAHSHLAQYPTGIKKGIYGFFKVLTKITSNVYFACGEQAAVYLYGKKNLQKGNVHIMHNAIDLEKYQPDEGVRKKLRSQLGIENCFCIGNVGRFTEQKNQSYLINAFSLFLKQNPSAKLLLVGEGALLEPAKELAEALQITDSVLFLGARDDVASFYQAMDLFVLPSLYEGLAVVLVETECAGLPILASDTVTREIDLLKTIQYLPLEESMEQWVVKMKEYSGRYETLFETRKEQSRQTAEVLKNAGYSIWQEAKKLDGFYTKALER